MKINTFIITILNIKIEDRKFSALIFKCLQYIDQHSPGSFQSLSETPRRKKDFQIFVFKCVLIFVHSVRIL